ncbi:MAG TPA: twin-arginine translocase TatA/TatE family subunit [Anaerolineales bacterium]|nr:twin-arginine translocase TatA/TatE family subunit [Anaerolineales bacterium]
MRLPGGMEWVIVLLIVLLLFGPGRIGRIAGELGKSIKAFRDGITGDKKDEEQPPADSSGNIEPK